VIADLDGLREIHGVTLSPVQPGPACSAANSQCI
jgi:hypothetical protein